MSVIQQEMAFPELPYYLKVIKTIDLDGDLVSVTIESKIHVERVIKMPNMWSVGFVTAYPNRFRGDVFSFIIKRYGLTLEPTRYS